MSSADQYVDVYTRDGHRAQATVSVNSANRVVVTTPGSYAMQLDAVADVGPFVDALRLTAELAINRMKRSL